MKKPYYRLLQVLNRNTFHKKDKYTLDETIIAFKKRDYNNLTIREKCLVSRLYQECDEEDMNVLIDKAKIARVNFKKTFETSPYVSREAFKEWNDTFGFKTIEKEIKPSYNFNNQTLRVAIIDRLDLFLRSSNTFTKAVMLETTPLLNYLISILGKPLIEDSITEVLLNKKWFYFDLVWTAQDNQMIGVNNLISVYMNRPEQRNTDKLIELFGVYRVIYCIDTFLDNQAVIKEGVNQVRYRVLREKEKAEKRKNSTVDKSKLSLYLKKAKQRDIDRLLRTVGEEFLKSLLVNLTFTEKLRVEKMIEYKKMNPKKRFNPMLLLTVNNSIGDKKKHFTVDDIIRIFHKRGHFTMMQNYAVKTIQTEATKEEIEQFTQEYSIPNEDVDTLLSAPTY